MKIVNRDLGGVRLHPSWGRPLRQVVLKASPALFRAMLPRLRHAVAKGAIFDQDAPLPHPATRPDDRCYVCRVARNGIQGRDLEFRPLRDEVVPS